DPEDVDISWQLDAYKFELPLLAAAMDGVVSPATAIEIGRLGGCGVLNLEGLWTRYEDADSILEDIANSPVDKATRRMQQVYGEPMKAELVTQRIREIKAAGVIVAAAITPQRAEQFMPAIVAGEIDILVIQGSPHATPRRNRCLRACHRGRRHGHRWRHRKGNRVWRGRGDDGVSAGRRPRGARSWLSLGHGDLPSHVASGCPRPDHTAGHAA